MLGFLLHSLQKMNDVLHGGYCLLTEDLESTLYILRDDIDDDSWKVDTRGHAVSFPHGETVARGTNLKSHATERGAGG